MSNQDLKCPECGSTDIAHNAFTDLVPFDEQYMFTCRECNKQFNIGKIKYFISFEGTARQHPGSEVVPCSGYFEWNVSKPITGVVDLERAVECYMRDHPERGIVRVSVKYWQRFEEETK